MRLTSRAKTDFPAAGRADLSAQAWMVQGLIYVACTSLPRGAILKKDLEIQGPFFSLQQSKS